MKKTSTVRLGLKAFETNLNLSQSGSLEKILTRPESSLLMAHSGIPESHQKNQISMTSPRLLIVDDSNENLFVLSSMLKKASFLVETAVNGQEAIEKYKSIQFDIILMDIQMPIKDGYSAIQEIRQWEGLHHQPRSTIIAVTANAMPEDRDKCIFVGATDYLSKPVKMNDLLVMIEKYLNTDLKLASGIS